MRPDRRPPHNPHHVDALGAGVEPPFPKLDVTHMNVVQRAVLGKLMKHRELTQRDLHTTVMVAGLSRKRGRTAFTDSGVEMAIEQIIASSLARRITRWQLDGRVLRPFFLVEYIVLTVDGWTIGASLELDKLYR